MKSVRLHGTGDLQIHDEPISVVKDGENLVRVEAVGVCGSDLHLFSEGEIDDGIAAVRGGPILLQIIGAVQLNRNFGRLFSEV